MRYGFVITAGGPREVAGLAREVEESGWDGAFYWDGMAIGAFDTYDPWVVMAAMAMRTEGVRIGAMLTPPARRRPWKLAREAATLDHLSGGRLVMPVGLGAVDDGGFSKVGEPVDRKTRAQKLDESLEILTGLWSGEPFSYEGRHYRLEEMTFLPRPVQRPRIPIWVVGAWPSEKSMGRALRYDGVLAARVGGTLEEPGVTPETIREIKSYVEKSGKEGAFDIVREGETPGEDPAAAASMVRPYAEAGATWWIEAPWTPPNSPEDLSRRIKQGPPRAD
ncbi:LLM class flavin-dependent oxidoreductase [Rubrobacter tropicus]|uniref:LLM class flavin-dependent oxidoreductase n=1 Tax=Rubrobacter tropicus TaxID=2653851 RepID=A0A6G8QED6_9ACTN|nr:LLM class flavin-dependent oxidoreductase [Rubrobacter tropicus]QIN84812.1 LLM class flavin-dependent oxidoreductase [Rubrobacter tropicus]